MTGLAVRARPPAPLRARCSLLVGLAAAVLLLACGLVAPAAALHGWLIGFALAGGAPLGALALLLIHALTGGRWGEAHRPALLRVSGAAPLLVLLVLPLVLGAATAFPWASDPSTAGDGVARSYLNGPAVGIRSVLGLGLLGALAWRCGRRRPGTLEAALGLCLFALFMNAAAYDWLLSLAPRFTASAFGAQVIVAQMLTGLCGAVLLSRAPAADPAWADLGGLMLALVLGESYLVLMGFAIDWYGDRPVQAAWYLARSAHGWAWLEAAGALGAVVPMLLLLFGRVRRDPAALRGVAVFVLGGLGIEDVWLVAPGTEPAAALAGIVGTVAAAGLLGAFARILPRREASRHGA